MAPRRLNCPDRDPAHHKERGVGNGPERNPTCRRRSNGKRKRRTLSVRISHPQDGATIMSPERSAFIGTKAGSVTRRTGVTLKLGAMLRSSGTFGRSGRRMGKPCRRSTRIGSSTQRWDIGGSNGDSTRRMVGPSSKTSGNTGSGFRGPGRTSTPTSPVERNVIGAKSTTVQST